MIFLNYKYINAVHTKSLEQFVESRPDLQRRLLKMLDSWIVMTDEQIARHCLQISPNLDSLETTSLNFGRVKQKVIKKVASRLAARDRFNLCDDMTVCRNLYFDKFHSYLNNVVLEFVAQVLGLLWREYCVDR